MQRRFGLIAALAVVLAGAPAYGAVTGISAGSDPLGDTTTTLHQQSGASQWDIGSTSTRIRVELDADEGHWRKVLGGPGADAFGVPEEFTANEGDVFQVSEYLQVEGPSWTDWHEIIATPDWTWGDVTILADGDPLWSATDVDDSEFEAIFDAVSDGTDVTINKDLIYTGTEPFEGRVFVDQFPTPEPSSALLLGAAGLLLGFRGRRSR